MRWIPLSLLLACGAPAQTQPPPARQLDVPAHTQAMIDAYRNVQASRAAKPTASAQCPSEDSTAQRREKYLRSVGGCVEDGEPSDPTLDVAASAKWPALYAALDKQQEGIDRCLREGATYFDLQGTLTSRVELTAEGAIKSVRGESSDVACCVRRALRQAHLPAPGRPIALEHVTSLEQRYSGTLPKETLRSVAEAHNLELRACYDSAVQQGLTHGGQLTLRFVIAPNGEVSRATVLDDTVGSPSAACCFVAKVRAWRFPEPTHAGPVLVTYPFVLQLGS